jgi:hypothetical protein
MPRHRPRRQHIQGQTSPINRRTKNFAASAQQIAMAAFIH